MKMPDEIAVVSQDVEGKLSQPSSLLLVRGTETTTARGPSALVKYGQRAIGGKRAASRGQPAQ
jgi:hypothetical protein